ncbi:hypothetical protein F4604DRAFT_535725 [Suillus subluteus]|nr:hypothetical protein F4604DRAFT_535725 [Suillus subluteus]
MQSYGTLLYAVLRFLLSLQKASIEQPLDEDARCDDSLVHLHRISPSIQRHLSCRNLPYSSHCLNFIPRSLVLAQCFPPSSCLFLPHNSRHPYTHRFHDALVPTPFVVNIVITCCTVQLYTMNYNFCPILFLAHFKLECIPCNGNLNDRK